MRHEVAIFIVNHGHLVWMGVTVKDPMIRSLSVKNTVFEPSAVKSILPPLTLTNPDQSTPDPDQSIGESQPGESRSVDTYPHITRRPWSFHTSREPSRIRPLEPDCHGLEHGASHGTGSRRSHLDEHILGREGREEWCRLALKGFAFSDFKSDLSITNIGWSNGFFSHN